MNKVIESGTELDYYTARFYDSYNLVKVDTQTIIKALNYVLESIATLSTLVANNLEVFLKHNITRFAYESCSESLYKESKSLYEKLELLNNALVTRNDLWVDNHLD